MAYALDPEVAAAVAMMPGTPLTDLVAMRGMESMLTEFFGESDTTGVDVLDTTVPGPEGAPDVPVRLYTPQNRERGPVPLVFNVHGGGFVIGSVELDHPGCLELCRALGVVVASVEYRLAPENPYPAGLEDCYAALTAVVAASGELGIDPHRVALHGASAGGGLAAALALLCRDRGGPALCFQYLGIPELDDRLETPSMVAFVDTPGWNRPNAEISWDAYLGPGRRGGDDVPVYAAPARATDLSGLPPAYISVMQFDPLRDEGIAYAQALLAAGVNVELHLFPGTFHASRLARQAEVSRREGAEEIAVLRRALFG
ncbi:alpha/beta hydrolase [Yinghuangia sp. YIM S09857]|uniref:alpha/beta hydrolase n=1 Tax=Yinghuangia sp. YIM S09857 TaxID=3436929 RepID=UPI003F5320D0